MAEVVVVPVGGTEELGDDGDVALGYPLIDDDVERGRRKPAAVVGYPLPPETRKQPRPPPRDKCASCKMFTKSFLVTVVLVLATDMLLGGIILQRNPNPLLVLLCLPFYPLVIAGGILLIVYCQTSHFDTDEDG